MFTTADTAMRELAHRAGDGLDVTLLWDSLSGQVFIAVEDERAHEWFLAEVRGADALHAFHHPYTYRPADPDGAGVHTGVRSGR